MTDEAFFELHRAIPRQGPGDASDVLWALSVVGEPARVIDAGCGPGADTETLAEALPLAQIEAVDLTTHFIEEARARLECFGPRVNTREGDMRDITGPADLIWCAGSLYFLGLETALPLWRGALAPGGAIVFSEPVFLSSPPSAEVAAFWADYPGVGTEAELRRRIAGAGFATRATRVITGRAWLNYYLPLMARAARLRIGAGPDLAAVLDAAEAEFARWRAAPDHIAYLLCVVAPE
ncbi:class I SAM-dependent methyltransferase [Albidovulum sediminicola]|uniref:Class I SAM-dependent methyltransferase n=1 Tax=Albidovulum sediminicola TaxID=2984331 RepID=A0ABT2YZM9_9RHOB|nr:class I SAM-dependent methyltransferase [Defluviimonas sp. WL0075]MCV2864345.1 class I SAM-dependent methyltransferase [Defluviimonas sp. WL0075]